MNENDNTTNSKTETSNDLEQLRDILYGNQARATEQWLDEMETRLENINRELKNSLDDQGTFLPGSTEQQFNPGEENLTQTEASLSQRLDQQINDLRRQLADFRAESRQRDADLRQEMLLLGAMLDRQNTERTKLGDLLVELRQQLQQNSADTAVSDND